MGDLLYLPWGQSTSHGLVSRNRITNHRLDSVSIKQYGFTSAMPPWKLSRVHFFVETSSSLPSPEGLQEFCEESVNSCRSRPGWWSLYLGSYTQTAILGLVVNASIDHTGRRGCYPLRTSCSPHTLRERWLRGCSRWFVPQRSCVLSRRRISCLKTTWRE